MDPSCGFYFPKEERVLALYPETTTFYGASIVTSAKRRKTGDYMVLFDEVSRAFALHPCTHASRCNTDTKRCPVQETDKKAIAYMYVLQYPQ